MDAAVKPEETAGELLKKLAEADNKVATARGALKKAEEDYAAIEDRIFALMDAQETETIRNARIGLQVSISENVVDTIEDWDGFTAFCRRHNLLHFFQRRLTPKALAEWRAANPKKKIPGLGAFTKRRLHVTTINK